MITGNSSTRFAATRSLAWLASFVLLTSCRASNGAIPHVAQHESLVDTVRVSKLQHFADSLRGVRRWPAVSIAATLPNGSTVAVTSGFADTLLKTPLRTSDKLMQGSVGKTYVSAVAMQLVAEGKLGIDTPIATYLAGVSWLDRIANARTITVRQLMNHTSGIVRYEFQPQVTAKLRAEPFKVWTVEDRLAVLFDAKPPFAPGEGWEYSDTNYIILGAIIERLTGHTYYAEMKRRILDPLGLWNTIPSDRPQVPGLANGYAGKNNDLGGYDASLRSDGTFAMNPQFEWTGGGIASTTGDLSRWAKLLYEGNAFPAALLPRMLESVPARLGGNARYGLGVIVRDTPLGAAWGHSGFFPGYATEMMYFPDLKISAAVQVNTSAPYPGGLPGVIQAVVNLVK